MKQGLALPLVAAPMTKVSTPELVVAAGDAGIIGAIPTHNPEPQDLGPTLARLGERRDARAAHVPYAVNLIVHASNPRRDGDLAEVVRHRPDIVITSVGSPAPVVAPLQEAGCKVLADVATMRHVERALAAGVDGLVLLSAGAGGQTGWLNPLAFVRAVRRVFDGPVILAGGIADGAALAAAELAGATLGYMGTRFIATTESGAPDDYKAALVAAGPDDVVLSTELTSLPTNLLTSSPPPAPRAAAPDGFEHSALVDNRDAWTAGHSVCGVDEVVDVAFLVDEVAAEYRAARDVFDPYKT